MIFKVSYISLITVFARHSTMNITFNVIQDPGLITQISSVTSQVSSPHIHPASLQFNLPSHTLLFSLFFTICPISLFLYHKTKHVVTVGTVCGAVFRDNPRIPLPPPVSPPGKAGVSRDSEVMWPVRHLRTMVTSLPQGPRILSLVIYIVLLVKLQDNPSLILPCKTRLHFALVEFHQMRFFNSRHAPLDHMDF